MVPTVGPSTGLDGLGRALTATPLLTGSVARLVITNGAGSKGEI